MALTPPILASTLLALPLLLGAAAAPQDPAPPVPEHCRTPEGLVQELYRAVCFEAGAVPAWDRVRAMFLEPAVIVLRTSRTETTVFDVDGFLADFVRFNERPEVREQGFTERIVRMKTTALRDLAHVLVLYEAAVTGAARPPQRGVDSIQLIRRDGRWWIVSITNEIPDAGHPLPAELRDEPRREQPSDGA